MGSKLWEFSLYFPREVLCYFEDLKTDLKKLLQDQKNCISLSICDNQYVLMMALTMDMYKKHILYIKQRIADIILLYYKPKIIINSINNFDLSHHDNVILIQILSSFEVLEDKNEIINNLSILDKLYLNSFVSFKLKKLTDKWKEAANLINENSLFLLDDVVKKELMQFLMEGISCKSDCINITQNGAEIACTEGQKTLRNEKLYYSLYDYDSTLFTLINHFPKQIKVQNYKNFDVAFIQTLSNLFGSKVDLIDSK